MNKRDVNTFAEKKSYIKKTDNTIRCKITRQKKLSTDPLQHLWEYNRSIYSVVKARKSIHTKESNEDKEKKTSRKLWWMINMERKMNNLWKQTSFMQRIEEDRRQLSTNIENEEKLILDDRRN